jgi:tetratricopeptide (TPR) repeat protein
VEHAVDAAHALTPLDGCNDIKQLKSLIPPPDRNVRARVETLRRELAQIKAVHDSGRYTVAIEQLKPVVDEARTLGYRPLEAEALVLMGRASAELGRLSEAEVVLDEAYRAALASRHDDLLPEFAAWQIWVVGNQGRVEQAEHWTRFGDATIERLGATDSVMYAWILNNMGAVYHLQGRFAQALEYQQRARAIKEKVLGADDPDFAGTLGNVALALNKLGQSDRALELTNRSIEIHERTLGNSHPALADELSNRGEILMSLDRASEALSSYEGAGKIWEREFGPHSPQIAYALTGAGTALERLGRSGEAISVLERALSIRSQDDGNRVLLAETEFALANSLWSRRSNPPRALEMARRAMEHYGNSRSPDDRRSAIAAWLNRHEKALSGVSNRSTDLAATSSP